MSPAGRAARPRPPGPGRPRTPARASSDRPAPGPHRQNPVTRPNVMARTPRPPMCGRTGRDYPAGWQQRLFPGRPDLDDLRASPNGQLSCQPPQSAERSGAGHRCPRVTRYSPGCPPLDNPEPPFGVVPIRIVRPVRAAERIVLCSTHDLPHSAWLSWRRGSRYVRCVHRLPVCRDTLPLWLQRFAGSDVCDLRGVHGARAFAAGELLLGAIRCKAMAVR
jgi:hypothetical protein